MCGTTGDKLLPATRVQMKFLPPDVLAVSPSPLVTFPSPATLGREAAEHSMGCLKMTQRVGL